MPTVLDEVAARALALPGRDEAAYTAPAELAAALTAAIPPVQVPPADARRDARRDAGLLAGRAASRSPPDADPISARRAARRSRAPGSDEPFRPGRRGAGRAIAVSLLLAVAVAGASAAALHLLNKSPSPASSTPPGKSHSPSTTSPAQGPVITPKSAKGFDALNPADRGDENSNQAENVLDGSSGGWSTQWYGSANFGSLKSGTGFILNLGTAAQVGSVTVTFGSRAGRERRNQGRRLPARSKANLDSMTDGGQGTDVSGSYTFTIPRPVTGQYLVIWFTKLPPLAGQPGKFEASDLQRRDPRHQLILAAQARSPATSRPGRCCGLMAVSRPRTR